MRTVLVVLCGILPVLSISAEGAAQAAISARAATVGFGGRLHAQHSTSSVDGAIDDFLLRRVRFIADITVNDFVQGRVQPDFARGSVALQDTYVRLDFSDAFRLSLGQFKRAFDVFELSSSTDLSLIERDGRIDGLDTCAGVGSVCSYSRFTQGLRYSERDQGIRVEGNRGRLGYEVTLTNGTGINVADENDRKSFSGRVTLQAGDDVSVSGQVGVHDWVDPAGDDRMAVALGGDVEVGTWRDGLHVQASVVGGDNWQLLGAGFEPATFLTFQAVATRYYPLQGGRLVALEPVARLSFGDPDTATGSDGGVLVTPGLMLYFGGKNKIGVNVDVYDAQGGTSEHSLKVQTFLYF